MALLQRQRTAATAAWRQLTSAGAMAQQQQASLGPAHLLQASMASSSGAAATVFERLVSFTLIDRKGQRHQVRGMEGQTVADAIREARLLHEREFYPFLAEPSRLDIHLYVDPAQLDKFTELKVPDDDAFLMDDLWDRIIGQHRRTNSRLGQLCQLTKDSKGLTVAVAEHNEWHAGDTFLAPRADA